MRKEFSTLIGGGRRYFEILNSIYKCVTYSAKYDVIIIVVE